ncbi:MAG: tRNA-dihydrouridine synthase family protein [Planctomycetaceae bacterium]|jgi:nifR3 family TIM-barrel protein|nr:tRNA-dihydrouridine synthase family protein [Planctomycetaceae bacterium]
MNKMFFPPLCLGQIEISFPIIQAALSGYSDAPMRHIARHFGAQFTLCEVMLDQFVISVSKRKSRLYFAEFDEHPVGAQLMGSQPEQFVRAAERLIDEGFDLIDLNFACPVKKVLGRGRGGYLLSNPQAALKIVETVRRNIPNSIPLTIKLRKGFDHSQESQEKFFEILDGSIELGVCGVTIHGRTVCQRYEGTSDWDFIQNVKRRLCEHGHSKIAVIGSGDLFTSEICLQRLRESGVDGLALARGIIGNPWLFRDLAALLQGFPKPEPPTLHEQYDVLMKHFRLAVELYGEHRAATTMRAFGIKYSLLHPETEKVRQAFVKVKTASDWYRVLEMYALKKDISSGNIAENFS